MKNITLHCLDQNRQYYLNFDGIENESLIKDFCTKYSKCNYDEIIQILKLYHKKVYQTVKSLKEYILSNFIHYIKFYEEEYFSKIIIMEI